MYIGDQDVTDLEARRRPTAMVFQNYALFPHMTVGENVAYGLNVRKMERSVVKERVREVLQRVDLEGYSDTPVTELSGGQQQRAALARAVAVEPEVLLFDEPLSNLDVALRHQTRRELKMLQHRLGVTSVYVTHDQEEALSLSDHVAVMRRGQLVQEGAPRDLYRNPDTAFVASFLGGGNVLRGEAARRVADRGLNEGMALSVRSEDIVLSSEGPYEGTVRSTQFLGSLTEAIIEWDGTELRCMTPRAVTTGESVRFSVRETRIVRDDA